MTDADLIRFYRTLKSALGMGQLWFCHDDGDAIIVEWHPGGAERARSWRESIPLETILASPSIMTLAERVAHRMREAHRVTVTDARHAEGTA